MRTISIRELHLDTGRWVRAAAAGQALVVTDRGRRVVTLRAFDRPLAGRPLPNRERQIRNRPLIRVDSAVYISEMRDRE